MITKIISGGQYGVDLAGLAVGAELGIETGGHIPKGYKTKYGPRPKLQFLGLIETESEEYPTRTFLNVKNSDGTIRFANNFLSKGELLTLKAIQQYKKPYLDIDLNELISGNYLIFDIHEWFKEHNIQVLNIAGNAGNNKQESSYIFELVKKHLSNWIRRYNA